jgi:hypothetical protein
MTKHVGDEGLVALVEGGGMPSDRTHVDACSSCAGRLDEARAGLDLALRAEVPEPSPLYWEALGRSVDRRIDEEPRRAARWRWLLPVATATAVVALALSVGHAPRPSARPWPVTPARVVPAWSALPPTETDDALTVLEGLAVADTNLASWDEGRGLGSFLAGLTDEESQALAESLRREGQEGDL